MKKLIKIAISLSMFFILQGCQNNSDSASKVASKNSHLPMCTDDVEEREGIFIDWVELANKYNSDSGAQSDYQKALCLYKKADKVKNVPEAQYNIGVMYFQGRGMAVPKDLQQAQQWFLKAANSEKGMPPASFALGTMYLDGNGVTQDYKQASEWLEKTGTWSSRDYRDTSSNAFLLLGKMHYHGMGTQKDNKTAFAYFWLSSFTGNKEAKHDLDILKKELSKNELNDAMHITNELNKKFHVLLDSPFPAIEKKQ